MNNFSKNDIDYLWRRLGPKKSNKKPPKNSRIQTAKLNHLIYMQDQKLRKRHVCHMIYSSWKRKSNQNGISIAEHYLVFTNLEIEIKNWVMLQRPHQRYWYRVDSISILWKNTRVVVVNSKFFRADNYLRTTYKIDIY